MSILYACWPGLPDYRENDCGSEGLVYNASARTLAMTVPPSDERLMAGHGQRLFIRAEGDECWREVAAPGERGHFGDVVSCAGASRLLATLRRREPAAPQPQVVASYDPKMRTWSAPNVVGGPGVDIEGLVAIDLPAGAVRSLPAVCVPEVSDAQRTWVDTILAAGADGRTVHAVVAVERPMMADEHAAADRELAEMAAAPGAPSWAKGGKPSGSAVDRVIAEVSTETGEARILERVPEWKF